MRRASFAVVLMAALAGLAGCGGPDPFTTDLRMICQAGAGRDDLPPDLRRMAAMREIAAKVKTPEAARLMAALVQAAPGDRAALLAPALAKAKLDRCPLFER